MTTSLSSYDEVPYPSNPYPQSHPDHLGTLGTLFGMRPAPAGRCRVLELGCASGGNLIPMALTLPGSTFVGVDLSREEVAQGQRAVEALGLTNIRLEHRGILEVGPDLGTFDYILCHGVYSWVPAEVQDHILTIFGRQLGEQGIAYLSYNTLPGWYMRGMIRDMMRYHVGRFTGAPPAEEVRQARALLAFLANSVRQENSPYGLLLRRELELLQKHSDSYLFHEHLEENNSPIYFLQMCERLSHAGLRYLGEAELHVMVPATAFPPDVQEALHDLAPDLLQMEQYMDFLRNRQFRQTLICREAIQPRYHLRGEHLFGFRLASPVKPRQGEVDLQREVSEEFLGRDDLILTASSPLVKAALLCLGELWPASLPFDDLLARAERRAGLTPGPDEGQALAADLGRALLTAHASAGERLVEISLQKPPFVTTPGERPVASPLARYQAASQDHLTNLRHETVHVAEVDRHILFLLDGTRSRDELVPALQARLEEKGLKVSRDDQPVTDPEMARELLGKLVDQQLPRLARAALLQG